MTSIHPSAVVAEGAQVDGATIGPFCVVGPEVSLGPGTRLYSHVVIAERTTVGPRCEIFPFAVLGGSPQDRKYHDEPTELHLGEDVIVREHATIHRGTATGQGRTVVGDRSMLMAYTHVAHDCTLGHDVVMSNGATLAGHVEVESYAVLGGFAAVGQLLRVGESAMLAAGAMVEQDAPPFCIVSGDRARVRALNVVGLRRRGMTQERISPIKQAFRLLFRSEQPINEAMKAVRAQVEGTTEIEHLLAFISESRKGVCR